MKSIEETKTPVITFTNVFSKSFLRDNVKKYGAVREAADNMTHARCMLAK
jgi:hypothetical protein